MAQKWTYKVAYDVFRFDGAKERCEKVHLRSQTCTAIQPFTLPRSWGCCLP